MPDYGGINAAYLGFWGVKIKFHQDHPEVSGDISPSKFSPSNYKTAELYVGVASDHLHTLLHW